MPQIKAVPEADPKTGKERRVSGTTAPYFGLSESIEVARAIHENGGSLDRTQLANKLRYSGTKNGTFLTRVSAAKIFGLVDQPPQSDTVRITPRGIAIVAPVDDANALKAKLDAFMGVELFRSVFDNYKGRELPPDVGLANLFENTYKIIPNRAGQAVKVMVESADTAGLFTMAGAASRKMIQPVLSGGGATLDAPTPKTGNEVRSENPPRYSGGGGNGGGPPSIDPAFIALLSRLPEPGTELSKTKRENVIAAFTAAINWIYPAPEPE